MHNPLAILCQQLGLDQAALARMLDCPVSRVRAALAEEPREPLRTYLKLGLALGVKNRLIADAPLRLWFDFSAIDGLRYSGVFRQSVGLAPLPTNRGELRRLIKRLRRRGHSYSNIAIYLQRNFIPTTTGVSQWRNSTIGQHLNMRVSGTDADMPLGATEEFCTAFRAMAIQHLLVAMCPFDPFASVRHEMEHVERAGRLYVQTKVPVPAAIRRWVVSAVARLSWFNIDQWGTVSVSE